MPENEVADQSMLPTQVSMQRSMVSGPNLGFDTAHHFIITLLIYFDCGTR